MFLRFNIFTDTACPEGWDIFDDVCIQVSGTKVLFHANDYTSCRIGNRYNNLFVGHWLKVNLIEI